MVKQLEGGEQNTHFMFGEAFGGLIARVSIKQGKTDEIIL